MSPPDSPTLVNRNANLAWGVQMRKSAAIATTLPAPAAMPWIPAMIGIGHSRIARMTSPVILVKPIRPAASIWISSPMISFTSPPPQKPLPSPRITSTRVSPRCGSSASRSRRSAYDSKVSGFIFSGRFRVTVATPSVDREVEVLPVLGDRRAGAVSTHSLPAVARVRGPMIVRCTSEAPS